MSQAFLAAASLVWGGAFVVGRILVSQLDPLAAAWLRFVIAAVAFLILEVAGRAGRGRGGGARLETAGRRAPGGPSVAIAGRDPRWVDYALLGLTGILAYNLFFFYGLTLTTAAESSLIIAASPVVVALIGWAFLDESLSPGKIGGISLSVMGVVLVILAGSGGGSAGGEMAAGGRLTGDLLMLGGVLAWAAYSALGKRVLRRVTPLAATARAVYWGVFFLTVLLLARDGPDFVAEALTAVGLKELLSLLYLALVCTVFGFVSWYRGLKTTDVSGAAAFLSLVPISTLVIAAATLGERPTAGQLLGGALVIGGVFLVGYANAARRAEREKRRSRPTRSKEGPGSPAPGAS